MFRERTYSPLSARPPGRNVLPDHGGPAAVLAPTKDMHVNIRDFQASDLPALTDLTIESFRPLFERHLPEQLNPTVFSHDHGDWHGDYRKVVPTFHDPGSDRFVTLAEEHEQILGYVGWNIAQGRSARLEMVAVHPVAQRRGVGTALCREVLERLRARGVAVVHIGTGGDAFHAPARRLYESLGFTGYPVVDYTTAL
jgi:ribosomal protein S18 acetylase RimI-like enzyme